MTAFELLFNLSLIYPRTLFKPVSGNIVVTISKNRKICSYQTIYNLDLLILLINSTLCIWINNKIQSAVVQWTLMSAIWQRLVVQLVRVTSIDIYYANNLLHNPIKSCVGNAQNKQLSLKYLISNNLKIDVYTLKNIIYASNAHR